MTARVTRVRRRVPTGGERFSAYARMLEDAATLASAEAGYPTPWYERAGTAWVIRRSAIDCAVPLAPAIDVEIVTWVADFRRVRSLREYEVYVPSGTVAALTAHADWVYVDRANGRPRRIPEAMMSAFVPTGTPPTLPRIPLALPEPHHEVVTIEHVATSKDVDALGHVNNARYFDYLEDGGTRVAGAGRRPVHQDLEYLAEAKEEDRLLCRCWAVGSQASRVEVAGEILLATRGSLLIRARSVWS